MVDSYDKMSETRVTIAENMIAYLRDDVFEEIEIKFVILLGDILFVAGRRLDGAVKGENRGTDSPAVALKWREVGVKLYSSDEAFMFGRLTVR